MRIIAASYRNISDLFLLNTDRFLAPLLIVASLTLAGWLVRIMSGL